MATKTKPVARLRDLSSGRTDLMQIDPKLIHMEKGHNPRNYRLRENREHLDSLKISIAKVGVKNPIAVRFDGPSGQAILVDGESRLTATLELIAEGLPIKTIPVFQVSPGDEAQRQLFAITANTGKPLSLLELGASFKKLINWGHTPEDVAASTGIPLATVNKALTLDGASIEVKQMVAERAITPALAVTHIRKQGDAAGKSLKKAVGKAQAEGKTIAKAERTVGVSKWEVLVRAAVKDFATDYQGEVSGEGKPVSDWFSISLKTATKLYNEVYPVKAAKPAATPKKAPAAAAKKSPAKKAAGKTATKSTKKAGKK